MVPVEVFDQLTAERARSLSQAVGSVRAEGLEVGSEVRAVTDRWLRGEISTVQMRELVRRAGLPCSHASRTQPPTSTLDLQYRSRGGTSGPGRRLPVGARERILDPEPVVAGSV